MADETDPIRSLAPSITMPIQHAFAITPNDSTDLATPARAIYVGTSGDLSVVTYAGDTVTFAGVPVGWFPVMVRRVRSTGTSADDLVGGV